MRRRRFIIAAVTALVALGIGLSAAGDGTAQVPARVHFPTSTLTIAAGGKTHHFKIEVARTQPQHMRGLMYRRHLAPDAGMLFIYASPSRITMWMKNTVIPLDMIFIDASGRIVDIAERTVPLSTATIASAQPALAVLEVNGGTVSRLGISRGDAVHHAAFGNAE